MTNENVIGYGAVGHGSNTVTLGNASTTALYLGNTLLTSTRGYATLSAGTVTVSTTSACTPSASCTYKLTNCGLNSSTAIGVPSIGTVVSGTSFVINSYTALAALAVDSSHICWQIN